MKAVALLVLAISLMACSKQAFVKLGNDGSRYTIEESGGEMSPFVHNQLRRDTEKTISIEEARQKEQEAIRSGNEAEVKKWGEIIKSIELPTNSATQQKPTTRRNSVRSNSLSSISAELRNVTVSNESSHKAKLSKFGIEIEPGQKVEIKADTSQPLRYELFFKKKRWTRSVRITGETVVLTNG